jgi:hypothetical protein
MRIAAGRNRRAAACSLCDEVLFFSAGSGSSPLGGFAALVLYFPESSDNGFSSARVDSLSDGLWCEWVLCVEHVG